MEMPLSPLREGPLQAAGAPPAGAQGMACVPPRAAAPAAREQDQENAPLSEEEWEPSLSSQQPESAAAAPAPAFRRLRKKGAADAPPPASQLVQAAPLEDTPPASPAAATAEEAHAPSPPRAASPQPPAASHPVAETTPAAGTPSRAEWARGVASAAGTSLLNGLRRLSASPLLSPLRVAAAPAAPAPAAPWPEPSAALADAFAAAARGTPLAEEAPAQPPRRRRLRTKRSLDAAAPPPALEAAPASPSGADALADALADVMLARPAPAATGPLSPPPAPKPAPPAPAPRAATAPVARRAASFSDDDDDATSARSESGSESAAADSSSDDDASDGGAASPVARRKPAARRAADDALVAVSDDDEAAHAAAPRLEFTDAASGARFVLSSRLSARLFPHQREGVTWMWRRHVAGQGGILGDDMGLGKTFQVASFLSGLLRGGAATRALVVAPTTLQAQWQSELERCGLGGCTRVYGEGNRAAALSAVRGRGGVLITSYGMVLHNSVALGAPKRAAGAEDAAGDEGAADAGDVDEEENGPRWDWVICDEGHKLKNPRMQLVARLTAVPAARRMLLTGTPVQNNLAELWALFNIVTPGLLGDARSFRETFDKPIARGQSREASARERDAGAATAETLKRRIAPAFLRREKAGVLTAPRGGAAAATDAAAVDAPPPPPPGAALGRKTDVIVWLRLTPPQRRLYAAFLGSASVAAALNKTGSALAALTVLKKICDHPGLLSQNAAAEIARGRPLASVVDAAAGDVAAAAAEDDGAEDGDAGGAPAGAADPAASCKSAFVLSFVAAVAAGGHRVLVFSQSRAMLDGIEAAAHAAGWRLRRIDGTVPAAERARRVAAFQADDSIPLFLLTSAVGGLGLTLTGADRVVVIDPSWNPAADAQAVDRAYRLGQTRDVAVYRLITCGTVEEKIYRKQVYKAGLSRAGTGGGDVARYFTSGELRDLFACDAAGLAASATAAALSARHRGALEGAPPDIAEELARVVLAHPAVAAVTDHDALFSAPDDTAPGAGVGGSPPSHTPATPGKGGGGGGGGKAPMQGGGGGGGGGWRGGSGKVWHGGADGGVLAAALARVPSGGAAPSAEALAAAAAAKVAARIAEVSTQIERFTVLIDRPTLALPDGGANLRAKRDALVMELQRMRASQASADAVAPQPEAPDSQAADGGADSLALAMGSVAL